MPQVIPILASVFGSIVSSAPVWGPVVSGVSGAVGLGEQVAKLVSGSDQSSMPNATPTPAPGPSGPSSPSGPTPGQQSALIQAATNLSSQNPYSSSTYYSTLAPSLAGVGGGAPNIDTLIRQALGIGGPSMTPSGTPSNLLPLASSPGISDYMSKTAAVIQ